MNDINAKSNTYPFVEVVLYSEIAATSDMIQCFFLDQWQCHCHWSVSTGIICTAKDTRSRLMLNNVMRDITLPVGVLWKSV